MSAEVDRIVRIFLDAVVEGVNLAAAHVMSDSIDEAPLGPGHQQGGHKLSGPSTLRESAKLDEASRHHLWANLSYNTPYAAAQHEGVAEMHRNGTIIHWEVHHHTTPGTKTKYLEDPLKKFTPRFEAFLAAHVRDRLEGHGVDTSIIDQLMSKLTIGSEGVGYAA
jgi:hypothetical protein